MAESHGPLVPSLAPRGHLALTEPELVAWGERLARTVVPPLLVTITGEVGAGKTTLVQAICRGYGVTGEVTSPTFALVHRYDSDRSPVYHLDLYRIAGPGDLTNLGWDDILSENALVVVEWPERAGGRIPRDHLPISLQHMPGAPHQRLLYAGGHV